MNRHTFFQRLLSSTPSEPHLLPPQAFFVESVMLGDVSLEELVGVARLALEDVSPLPLELLSWGVFTLAGSSKGILYATTKERLRGLEAKLSDGSLYELPAFLAALPEKAFELKTVIAFIDGQALSLLLFEANERIPSKVLSFVLPEEDMNPEDLLHFKESHEASWVSKGYHNEPCIYRLKTIEPTDKGGVILTSECLKEDGTLSDCPSISYDDTARLWLADVRDESFKIQEAKNRRLEALLTYIWKGGASVLIFLIILELILSIGSGWNHLRQNKIDAQEPAVQTALQHQSLLEGLRDLYSSELKPFEMLDLVNQVRPKELYFNQFSSEDYLHADIKGTGSSVDQVNEYADLVKQIPEVEAVLVTDVQTRQGKVQFNLQITFHPPVEIIEDLSLEEVSDVGEETPEDAEKKEEMPPVDPALSSPLAQPEPSSSNPAAAQQALEPKKPESLPSTPSSPANP